MMKKWLKEPLVHFMLLGAGLFLFHGVWQKWVERKDYTIQVSAAEIQRQAAIFATENQRQPTDDDIQALLFAHVEEEILMREAFRLGLDDGDTIVRRRLAQKMRFMIDDNSPPALPAEAELREWFEARKSDFNKPEKRAFSHIYISPNEHEDVTAYAAEMLSKANDANWKTLGDPFIEQSKFGLMNPVDVSRKFGRAFGNSVFKLPLDKGWQGPVSSSYGLHLVRIDEHLPEQAPDFDEATLEITKRWQTENVRSRNQKRLEEVLKKYKVDVEDVEP